MQFIQENRANCFLVTGNLDIWIEPIAALCGCGLYCSSATISDSRLKLNHILNKAEAIVDIRAKRAFDRVVAIGDGANEIPMLEAADTAIAFGGVHPPARGVVGIANYVVHDGASLCKLLRAQLSPPPA